MDTIVITIDEVSTIWNARPVMPATGDWMLWRDQLIKTNLLAWSDPRVVTPKSIDLMQVRVASALIQRYVDYIESLG
jgi:hypothetical protein